MKSLVIVPAQPQHEGILWQMLYYAAHMEQDGTTDSEAARQDPYLQKYVADWGMQTDLGVIGYNQECAIGAVWSRLLIGGNRTNGYIDEQTPEIAAAILPAYRGHGVGTQLLLAYIDQAKGRFPAVSLNVRADNPAFRLYRRVGFVVIDTITNRVGSVSYNMILRFQDA